MKQAENKLSSRNALQSGYELLWYQIQSVLGQGAFGITYLAQDINLNRLVAIKEFLPSQYAMRDINETVRPVSVDNEEKFSMGLRRFIEEARILDQLDHPNIVRVMNIFEANNTAYMVMNYEQGVNLKEILLRQKLLDESDLLKILIPILNGLETIHGSGFIHRDIKPANIFIRTDGTPVLLDFGSARQSLEKDTHTLTSLVSPGYAPIEQYVSKSDKQGPWSDIYGMAATLYRAVTGVPPSDAVTRGESLTGTDKDNLVSCRELADARYSDQFISAIEHGLAFLTRDRPQTIAEWRHAFLSSDQFHKGLSSSVASGEQSVSSIKQVSSQIASLVQASLTESVTKIHENGELSDYWDKEDATSVELAHRQGFRRGLKFALVILTLLILTLLIGNFSKIQQVVSPGFVPQDIISDKPVELAEDNRQPITLKASEITSDILAENPPPILDEETANELEAEGKIIILENSSEPALISEPVPATLVDESEQLDPLTGDELFNDFSVEAKSEQQLILKDETVLETQTQFQDESIQETITVKSNEKQEASSSLKLTVIDERKFLEKTPLENSRSHEVYVPNRNKFVEIEEVHVPAKPKPSETTVTEKFKGWVDFMVNTVDNPEQGKDQTGGKVLENNE